MFGTYEGELLAWNKRMNLVAKGDESSLWTRHFLDSLIGWSLALSLHPYHLPHNPAVLDIGTGAGFPGLPIKLVWPEINLTLVESIRKKTLFLKHLVETLKLRDASVLNARAESLARDPAHESHYDCILSRAVTNLNNLIKLGFPLLKDRGRLIAWCGGEPFLSSESRVSGHESLSYRLPGESRKRNNLILTRGETSHGS
jgi:16S rRNA (guanine527-N7)-methyltransferase